MNQILSMDAETYFKADGVSRSDLENIIPPKTPAHYRAYKSLPKGDSTPAQRIGTILHRSILEPETMDNAFAVKPEGMSFSTKEGKSWRGEHEGFEIISFDEDNMIRGMVKSVWANPIASRLIKASRHEASIFAEDDKGTMRKARVDILPDKGNALGDIKTCEAADYDSFCKAVLNYGYHRQAAYSIDIMKLLNRDFDTMIFIAVEKEPPYLVATYPIDLESIEIGRIEYNSALTLLRHCIANNEWHGYDTGLESYCGLPEWYIKRLQQV